MADTPAPDKPKRRPATKTAAGKAPAKKPRAAKKAAAAPKSAAPAPAVQAKPKRTPRKPAPARAAPATKATPTPTPTPTAARRPAPAAEVAPRLSWIAAAAGAIAAIGGAVFLWRSSTAEEPDYEVIESDGPIEIRKYPALVTAATEANGERRRALDEGFKRLADYIFAKSRRGPKLAMTAPVLSDGDSKGWRTRFIMPVGTPRSKLPAAPEGVTLVSEPPARIAAISFAGNAGDDTLAAKEGALRSWLQIKGLPNEGKAIHAFYNAPFLPGPLRRNEVMIVLSDESGTGA